MTEIPIILAIVIAVVMFALGYAVCARTNKKWYNRAVSEQSAHFNRIVRVRDLMLKRVESGYYDGPNMAQRVQDDVDFFMLTLDEED